MVANGKKADGSGTAVAPIVAELNVAAPDGPASIVRSTKTSKKELIWKAPESLRSEAVDAIMVAGDVGHPRGAPPLKDALGQILTTASEAPVPVALPVSDSDARVSKADSRKSNTDSNRVPLAAVEFSATVNAG